MDKNKNCRDFNVLITMQIIGICFIAASVLINILSLLSII